MRLLFLTAIKSCFTLITVRMAITVTLADSISKLAMAHQLVRDTYMQAFQLDINDLNVIHTHQFNADVLIAFDSDNQQILGTMSVMYPDRNGVFPCESLFGFDLSSYRLSFGKYVEIGRFATSYEGKRNHAVVISLFLGALRRLQSVGADGWVATVKDDIFGFLRKLALPLRCIEQAPKLLGNDPLMGYVGSDAALHLFGVSLRETEDSFRRFESYLVRGTVKVVAFME